MYRESLYRGRGCVHHYVTHRTAKFFFYFQTEVAIHSPTVTIACCLKHTCPHLGSERDRATPRYGHTWHEPGAVQAGVELVEPVGPQAEPRHDAAAGVTWGGAEATSGNAMRPKVGKPAVAGSPASTSSAAVVGRRLREKWYRTKQARRSR